jgi:drug/metabolite transporter (DMT)-like permease
VTGRATVISTPYLAWLSVCLIWGTTYLAIRVALESIPPALVAGLRWPFAGLIVIAALRLRGEPLPPLSAWPRQALLGLLLICLGNGAVVFAEQWVPSGIAAVIVGSAPFWMAMFEALLPGGERITARIVAGLGIGFGGLLLLVWPDLTVGGASGRQFALGLVLLQVACIGWSLGSSYSRRQPAAENPLGASALQMLFGGAIMLALATMRGEWRDLAFTPRAFWAQLYLIVVGSLAGYSAYIYALKHLPISTVSLYAYINPVIAVILGAILLGEAFGVRVVAASAIVLLGVAVVRGSKAQGSRLKAQTQR